MLKIDNDTVEIERLIGYLIPYIFPATIFLFFPESMENTFGFITQIAASQTVIGVVAGLTFS